MNVNALWIDDVPQDGVLFRRCLEERGIEVDVANSFYEALHRVHKGGAKDERAALRVDG